MSLSFFLYMRYLSILLSLFFVPSTIYLPTIDVYRSFSLPSCQHLTFSVGKVGGKFHIMFFERFLYELKRDRNEVASEIVNI